MAGRGRVIGGQGHDSSQVPGGGDLLRGARPGAGLSARLTRLAGRDGRYAGCDDATLTVAAARWAAVAAHAEAMKLAALAEMIRRSPGPGPAGQPAAAGDMPQGWEFGLGEQAALELACSPGSAEQGLLLGWRLAVRLPLTWQALHAGVLDAGKARLVAAETAILDDAQAGEAERQLCGYWAGRTWAQLHARITRIVANLDPDAVAKKREQAQKDEARVRFWREATGACALAGYGLPPDEALQADARIQARARAYRRAGIPGTMDQLRAAAYLDLLNGADARDRLGLTAHGEADGADATPDGADTGAGPGSTGSAGSPRDQAGPGPGPGDGDGDGDGGNGDPDDDDPDHGGEPGGDSGGGGPGTGGPGGNGSLGGNGRDGRDGYGDGLAANLDLTLPLATLLGLAERAGEAARLGAADPALARNLAAAAIQNPGSNIRIIITGADGRATGFGIAKQRRRRRTGRGNPPPPGPPQPAGPAGRTATPKDQDQAGADIRGNGGTGMTVSGTRFGFWPTASQQALPLDGLARHGGERTGQDLTAPGGWGTWRLAAAGREWDVELIPLPAPGPCAHEFGTTAYQPGGLLRALVQVRDGGCAMPACGHLASGTQWEHATPWPAGKTCNCNGGLHCTRHHRIKDQAPGWTITQLPDGRRRWTTPKGLTYTSQHRQYPDLSATRPARRTRWPGLVRLA